MKWTLILAFGLVMATACEKSNLQDNETSLLADGTTSTEKNSLVGKWRLVEYYQDNGDGTGKWVAATENEEITFTASGQISATANSPIASRGYTNYKIVDGSHVQLYSSSENKDEYYYNREDETHLLFNPQCRENCSRRYVKIG